MTWLPSDQHSGKRSRGQRASLVFPDVSGGEPGDDVREFDAWISSLGTDAFAEVEEVLAPGRQLGDQVVGRFAAALTSASLGLGTSSSSTATGLSALRLQHLDLSGNLLSDQGAVALAECMTSLREHVGWHVLRSLCLSSNHIGPDGAEAVAISFFPPGSSRGNAVRVYTLILSENPLGDEGVASVAAAIRIRQCRA
ncbi:unnamed protein product, partial [Polarella glacialis]